MDKVRIGVIGYGVMGPRHAEVVSQHPKMELAGVADHHPERFKVCSAEHDCRMFVEGGELIDDPEIDAVILALPAHGRTELALQAFANGKHVLTEKPVAMNSAEVEQLIAAKGDLVGACCSSRYRFPQGAQVAADFIATGALGDLRTVHHRNFHSAAPPPDGPRPEWRLKRELNGGGFLMNWGCYDLDYLLGITGWRMRPVGCFAQTWQVPDQLRSHLPEGSTAETQYIALINCEGGTMLSLERGEYMPLVAENSWEILGSRGSLRLHMLIGNPKQIIFDEATEAEGFTSRVIWEGQESSDEVMAGPIVDFAESILEGREPATSLERALMVQKISDAIYRSAESGECVPV